VDVEEWTGYDRAARMTTGEMRAKIDQARAAQARRFPSGDHVDCNARIPERRFRELCAMEPSAEALFVTALKSLKVSARARGHIIRVARTIADIAGAERIGSDHVTQALGYRS
jgi:magnesium chelatase family protein